MDQGLWAVASGIVVWALARVPAFAPDARRVARAKKDAELLAQLPPGSARDRLGAEVDAQVTQLLLARERRRTSWIPINSFVTSVLPASLVAAGLTSMLLVSNEALTDRVLIADTVRLVIVAVLTSMVVLLVARALLGPRRRAELWSALRAWASRKPHR